MGRKILLLHDEREAPSGVGDLAGAMRALGAEVDVLACAEPFEAVLDAVAAAETVVFWR